MTHLGLRRPERTRQLAHLVAHPPRWPGPAMTILLGDLNEWRGVGGLVRRLPDGFACAAPRSFPARAPILRLDAVAVHPGGALRRVWAHASPTARLASDHRPACADLAGG